MATAAYEQPGGFPTWFIRALVIASFGLLSVIAGAIWWAATLSADLRNIQTSLNITLDRQAEDIKRLQKQHDDEMDELEARMGDIELRHQYLDKRVEVIKDRTGMRDIQ